MGTRFPNAMRNLQFSLMPYLRHGHLSPYDVMEFLTHLQENLPLRFARIGSRLAHGFLTSHEIGLIIEYYQDPRQGLSTHIPPYLIRRFERQPKGKEHVDWHDAFVGNTNDKRWNEAQQSLAEIGKIPDFKQRYWVGRIFEWSTNWVDALNTIEDALQRYSLLTGKGCIASLVGIMLGTFYETHSSNNPSFWQPGNGFPKEENQDPAA